MNEHPIENLMNTAMNSIKDMIDVNTIIGEPIETSNNVVIIPISKVGFGFAAGGSEFRGETVDEYTKKEKEEQVQYRLPFGGGNGAGVSISPVAFLVVGPNSVRLLPVDHDTYIDRLLDYVPDLMEKANELINRQMTKSTSNEEQGNQHSVSYNPKTYNSSENDNMQEKNIEKEEEEFKNEPHNKNINSQMAKPKKSTKFHRPKVEDYDFEYDETNDDEQ